MTFINDLKDNIEQFIDDVQAFWYWDTRLEKALIKLGIREEFSIDRFYELVGVEQGTDDWADGFWDDYEGMTTIEVANAYFSARSHDAWISRAMDPTCWDY